jgi:hypothetical protein
MPRNTSLLVWNTVFLTSSGSANSAVSTFACSPGRWKHWICVRYRQHHGPRCASAHACEPLPHPTRAKGVRP